MADTENNKIEISAGIAIIYDGRILLAHPTKGNKKSWSIPKGKVEEGETLEEAACRETSEELGITIEPDKLKNKKVIVYNNRISNEEHKKLYYYIHRIKSLDEIGLRNTTVPKSQLEKDEIDEARFMYKTEADDYIFWRQEPILDHINRKTIKLI
jgi:8-oxo-dGTP pyrophosphatase MutT (NUDIX family)